MTLLAPEAIAIEAAAIARIVAHLFSWNTLVPAMAAQALPLAAIAAVGTRLRFFEALLACSEHTRKVVTAWALD